MNQIRLLKKDLKSEWRFLSVLFLTMWFGLLGLASMSILGDSIGHRVNEQSRSMLGGDFSLQARRYVTEDERGIFKVLAGDRILGEHQVTSTLSMVRSESSAKLVQLRGVSEGFPQVGRVLIESGTDLKRPKLGEVWLYPDLIEALDVTVGDSIGVGKIDLKVAGVISQDLSLPTGGAAVASRIYLTREDLLKSELIVFGSTFFDQWVYKLKEGTDLTELEESSFKVLTDPGIRAQSHMSYGQGSARVFGYLKEYLSVISLISVILSLFVIGYLVGNYLRRSAPQFAVMNALGATWKEIKSYVVLKVILISVIATLLAYVSGLVLAPVVGEGLKESLPVDFKIIFTIESLLALFIVGPFLTFFLVRTIVSSLSSLPVSQLFSESPSFRVSNSSANIWSYLMIALILFGVSFLLSKSIRLTLLFLAVTVLLFVLSIVFIYLYKLILGAFSSKHMSVSSIVKKSVTQNFTGFAIGWGVFFSVCLLSFLVPQVRDGMLAELSLSDEERPEMFLFDIQESQVNPLTEFLNNQSMRIDEMGPLIRSKFVKIKNEEVLGLSEASRKGLTREEQEKYRFINRGINLSYSEALPSGQELVKGEWFSGRYNWESEKPIELSIELDYSRRLGLDLGDTVTIEIQGVEFVGVVTSIRKVYWNRFQPAFFVLVQPGALDDAPKIFVASVKGELEYSKTEFMQKVSERFGNVSVVDVEYAITAIQDIISQVSYSIRILAALLFLLGVYVFGVVLVRMILSRISDYKLFKLLGAEKGFMGKLVFIEFVLPTLSLIAISFLISIGVTYLALAYLFNVDQVVLSLEVTWYLLAALVLSLAALTYFLNTFVLKKTYSRLSL
jgi:putative ABC transport system permease protein